MSERDTTVKWISDNAVTLAVTAVSIGVTWLVAWLYYRRTQRDRCPCYEVHSQELIGESSLLSPDVEVKHRGESLPRVTLSRLVFWNAGREPIRAADGVNPSDWTVQGVAISTL